MTGPVESLRDPEFCLWNPNYQFPKAQCAVKCLALNWTKHPHSEQVISFKSLGHAPQIASRRSNSLSPQKSAMGSAAASSWTSSGVISIEASSFFDSQTGHGSDIRFSCHSELVSESLFI